MRALMAVAVGVLRLPLAGCGGASGSSRPAERAGRRADFRRPIGTR